MMHPGWSIAWSGTLMTSERGPEQYDPEAGRMLGNSRKGSLAPGRSTGHSINDPN